MAAGERRKGTFDNFKDALRQMQSEMSGEEAGGTPSSESVGDVAKNSPEQPVADEKEVEKITKDKVRNFRNRLYSSIGESAKSDINFLIRSTLTGLPPPDGEDVEWDEATLERFLTAVPDQDTFDEKIINEQANKYLRIINDPKSSEEEKKAAQLNFGYKYGPDYFRRRQKGIKAILYGKLKAARQEEQAKNTEETKPSAEAEIQAPQPREEIREDRSSQEEPAAELSQPPLREGAVSSTESRKEIFGAAKDARVKKQFEDFEKLKNPTESVDAETLSEDVDPTLNKRPFTRDEIDVLGKEAKAAGVTELSQTGVEAENVPVKVSARGWNASVPVPVPDKPIKEEVKWEDTVRSFKLNKTDEAKIDDADYGPAWSTSVATSENESAVDLAEKEKQFIEKHSPLLNTLGEMHRENESKTPDQARELALKRQETRGASPEALLEFEKAYDGWRSAREQSNKLEKELYGYEKKNEYGSTEKIKGKYQEFLEKQGWRGWVNAPRKFLGLKPIMPRELQRQEESFRDARAKYFENAKLLKVAKINRNGDNMEVVARVADAFRKNQTLPSEAAAVSVGEAVSSEKIQSRYQSMLAHRLILGVNERRLSIQQQILAEAQKDSKLRVRWEKFGKPTIELMRKYRTVRWGATAVGYAVLAGATGGVGAAALAGGGYLARVKTAALVGGGAGTAVRSFGQLAVGRAERKLDHAEISVRSDLFSKGFIDTESNIDALAQSVERRKGFTRAGSLAAAVTAGIAGGSLAGETVADVVLEPEDSAHSLLQAQEVEPTVPEESNFSVVTGEEVPPTIAEESQNVLEAKELGSIHFTNLPEEKLQGVPGDLRNVPRSEITESPKKIEFMGDAKVAEAAQPEVQKAIIEIEEGEKVGPEYRPFDGHIVVPSEIEEPTLPPEEAIEAEIVKHPVEKGDNVWNIMEGKGPDANPIGGKSEVLKGMSLAERQDALNTLVEYYEHHPDEAKDIGVIKSGGNIHKIYPGEEINVTALDDKLRSLLGIETTTSGTNVVEANDATVEVNEDDAAEILESSASVIVHGEDGEFEIENPVNDVNQMTVKDVINLEQGVVANDPEALRLLGEMDIDKESFRDVTQSIISRGEWGENGDLTVLEYLEKFKDTPSVPPRGIDVENADGARFVSDTNEARNPLDDKSSIVREVSVENSVTDNVAVNKLVFDVEKARGLIFREPDVSGTFDKLKDLTFGDMRELAEAGRMPEGVTAKGWDRWAEELNSRISTLPAQNNETIGQYVARAAGIKLA